MFGFASSIALNEATLLREKLSDVVALRILDNFVYPRAGD